MSSIRYCRHCNKELYDHAGCYERAEKFEEMKQWKSKYEELKEGLLQSLDERIKSLGDEYIESKSDYIYGCLDEARYIRQSIMESFEEDKNASS